MLVPFQVFFLFSFCFSNSFMLHLFFLTLFNIFLTSNQSWPLLDYDRNLHPLLGMPLNLLRCFGTCVLSIYNLTGTFPCLQASSMCIFFFFHAYTMYLSQQASIFCKN